MEANIDSPSRALGSPGAVRARSLKPRMRQTSDGYWRVYVPQWAQFYYGRTAIQAYMEYLLHTRYLVDHRVGDVTYIISVSEPQRLRRALVHE